MEKEECYLLTMNVVAVHEYNEDCLLYSFPKVQGLLGLSKMEKE